MIYKYKKPHKHLSQMKSFCWPASVQMILFRNDVWVEQEQLAFDLWVIIEEKNKEFYNLPFKRLTDGDPLHWFKFYFFESEQIVNMIADYGFSISVIYHPDINNFEDLIIKTIEDDRDMIINYKRAWIRWNDYKGWHYVVLSSYDSDKKELTVCDPTPRAPNYWNVPLSEMKEAMSWKWDGRERGVVVFEKNT